VHRAIKLAKGGARKTRQELDDSAIAEIRLWQADRTKTSEDIAVAIFEPLTKKSVSKAEVAEQLALLVDQLPIDAATARAMFPSYLVEAIDYATGPAPAQPAAETGGAAS
jgi:hypothetical protein